jgi:glycine cleavage system H lipoate-binding protein
MFSNKLNSHPNKKFQNFLIKNSIRFFMVRYKIDFNHWISYENGISIIGCTSKGQTYYNEISNFRSFVTVGQIINVKDTLFGIETGYFKDYPIMKYFSSPIQGVIQEINLQITQNPISLIQNSELDAWLIKIRVDPNNIETYFSHLRELDYNKL